MARGPLGVTRLTAEEKRDNQWPCWTQAVVSAPTSGPPPQGPHLSAPTGGGAVRRLVIRCPMATPATRLAPDNQRFASSVGALEAKAWDGNGADVVACADRALTSLAQRFSGWRSRFHSWHER